MFSLVVWREKNRTFRIEINPYFFLSVENRHKVFATLTCNHSVQTDTVLNWKCAFILNSFGKLFRRFYNGISVHQSMVLLALSHNYHYHLFNEHSWTLPISMTTFDFQYILLPVFGKNQNINRKHPFKLNIRKWSIIYW